MGGISGRLVLAQKHGPFCPPACSEDKEPGRALHSLLGGCRTAEALPPHCSCAPCWVGERPPVPHHKAPRPSLRRRTGGWIWGKGLGGSHWQFAQSGGCAWGGRERAKQRSSTQGNKERQELGGVPSHSPPKTPSKEAFSPQAGLLPRIPSPHMKFCCQRHFSLPGCWGGGGLTLSSLVIFSTEAS